MEIRGREIQREERIREAAADNGRLLAAIDDIDFSTRKAITNEIFRRMAGLKIAFGWADAKIAYECGVVPVTLKTFLADCPEAREIWDAAKISYTQRLNDLAHDTLEWVMAHGKDENARVKAAAFVKERRDPDFRKRDEDEAGPGRVLLAQQIVVKIVDKTGVKPAAIAEAAADQAEIAFEAAGPEIADAEPAPAAIPGPPAPPEDAE